uniref:BZIP transcription factor bZIP132 n=1 Tax=Solanum tuberosum TaxID=4113 RepID=M1AA84_SOLTU
MSFQRFYDTWFDQLKEIVRQLSQVPRPATSEQHRELHQQLVQKVVSHIYEYYRVKSLAAKNDILSVYSAPWSTSLERSLHWIAGWRPTTAFHLIYTESSILFESHIIDILRGLRYGDLGDLSPDQLARVSELQCEAVQEENSITDEFNDWQARNPHLSLPFSFFFLRPLCHLQ